MTIVIVIVIVVVIVSLRIIHSIDTVVSPGKVPIDPLLPSTSPYIIPTHPYMRAPFTLFPLPVPYRSPTIHDNKSLRPPPQLAHTFSNHTPTIHMSQVGFNGDIVPNTNTFDISTKIMLKAMGNVLECYFAIRTAPLIYGRPHREYRS